ncbi:hypothetical protein D9611_004852 [Ephemerocybe angulata]|uniref:Endonuclease/exonuclease/phosphatase domain-containing protein n=1 Tax=Ephemerocybe angulata TaxID=980116 RepID=A0A8H5B2W2_9AGAR|nr:hypothetical protein D9611_004852 [Tulosesus angulatus]
MPPKRNASLKASGSKRKVEERDTDTEEDTQRASQTAASGSKGSLKRTKTEYVQNGQPKNKVLPVNIKFEKRKEGTVRIAAWNVCGWAASQKKGFKSYVDAEDPDILVLTETKANDVSMDPALKARFPYQYWSISNKKGYSGTAILSKVEPLSVDMKLPGHPDPTLCKGRIITLEYEHAYIIGTYVVNAGQDLKTLPVKEEWNKHFDAYIRDLDKKKPVIWTGDLNVAPTAIDLANAKKAWNKQAGYTEAETTAFKKILANPDDPEANKFTDVWRSLHPDLQHYTYWSYRFQCREKCIGWRLDMFVLSERIADKVKMCEIRDEIYGASDHVPLVMDIETSAISETSVPE